MCGRKAFWQRRKPTGPVLRRRNQGRDREGTEEGAMSLEQRLNYLLRAALRAERNGDYRVARALRRMADDIQPIDPSRTLVFSEASRP